MSASTIEHASEQIESGDNTRMDDLRSVRGHLLADVIESIPVNDGRPCIFHSDWRGDAANSLTLQPASPDQSAAIVLVS